MTITAQEYNELVDEYEATYSDLVQTTQELTLAQSALKELRKEKEAVSTKLVATNSKMAQMSSELESAHKAFTHGKASMKKATVEMGTLRGDNRRLKEQVKRLKASKPEKVKVDSREVKELRKQLALNQEALNKSAVYVGNFTDHRDINHLVFDDRLCTMVQGDGSEFTAHRVLVVDEHGSGKVCYKNMVTGEIAICKAPANKHFQKSKTLVTELENYFGRYDPAFYKRYEDSIKSERK